MPRGAGVLYKKPLFRTRHVIKRVDQKIRRPLSPVGLESIILEYTFLTFYRPAYLSIMY